jgi:branched-chain amino acid transport system ATP-binding protein
MSPDGTAARAVVLDAQGISLAFGGVRAVNDVSLAVHEREISAIIGPNGAGKTTFFNTLSGYLVPDAGRVFFRGAEITRMPNYRRIQRGMSRTFQTPSIFPELTVRENVLIGVQSQMGIAHRFRTLSGALRRQVEERIDELLRFVNLGRFKDRQVTMLSHGSQRLVEIAMSLSISPVFMLLDEPTAGLAEADTTRIMDVVRDLHKRLGLTVLFVEHNMRFVTALADTVMCMDRGRVLKRGTPSEVLNDPVVRAAYLGSEEVAHV